MARTWCPGTPPAQVGHNRDQIVSGVRQIDDLYRLAHVQDADLASGPDCGKRRADPGDQQIGGNLTGWAWRIRPCRPGTEAGGMNGVKGQRERGGEMSTATFRRNDTAVKDSDCDTGKDPKSVDEHVADFERPARHQLLTKLQSHAQQYHGEGGWDGEKPAFDGQERQQGQPSVGAEVQHLVADGQPPDGAHHRRTGGQQRADQDQQDAEEPENV